MIGAVAGLLTGVFGEVAVLVVNRLFPTDVLIVGFALVWAVPLGVLVGVVSTWRGWFGTRFRRGLLAAVPGLLAGVIVALMQWSTV